MPAIWYLWWTLATLVAEVGIWFFSPGPALYTTVYMGLAAAVAVAILNLLIKEGAKMFQGTHMYTLRNGQR